jgi:hypothetical protein
VSTGDPSVSPSAHQPGNPRRGEPGNLGALGAPPAGGALGTPARDEAWVLAVNADDDFYDSLIIAAGYEPDEYDNDDPWVDRTFDHFWEQQCRLFPDWVTANEHGELSVSLENIHPSDLNADDVRDVARWRNRAIRQAQRRARARADLEVGREEALVATPSVPATKLAAD